MKHISHKRLTNLLRYNPKSGKWVWLHKRPRREVGDEAGYIWVNNRNNYRRRILQVDGIKFYASRLAWFYMTRRWPKDQIDHKDNNSLNDRWSNLREATPAQNSRNRVGNKNSRLGIKGIYFWGGKYRARIGFNRKLIHIGVFRDAKEAHKAYSHFAKKLYGRFERKEDY